MPGRASPPVVAFTGEPVVHGPDVDRGHGAPVARGLECCPLQRVTVWPTQRNATRVYYSAALPRRITRRAITAPALRACDKMLSRIPPRVITAEARRSAGLPPLVTDESQVCAAPGASDSHARYAACRRPESRTSQRTGRSTEALGARSASQHRGKGCRARTLEPIAIYSRAPLQGARGAHGMPADAAVVVAYVAPSAGCRRVTLAEPSHRLVGFRAAGVVAAYRLEAAFMIPRVRSLGATPPAPIQVVVPEPRP